RRRHTRSKRDWSSDVCSSDLCPFHGVIDVVEFHGRVSSPAPQEGIRQCPVVGCIPSHALGGAGDPELLHLPCKVRCQRLADRVPCSVEKVKLCLLPVFLKIGRATSELQSRFD